MYWSLCKQQPAERDPNAYAKEGPQCLGFLHIVVIIIDLIYWNVLLFCLNNKYKYYEVCMNPVASECLL